MGQLERTHILKFINLILPLLKKRVAAFKKEMTLERTGNLSKQFT